MSLSQCVIFTSRFGKWKQADDGTNNDALCLHVIYCMNVPLITAGVNQAQMVLMILGSSLVLTVSFMSLHCQCFRLDINVN